MNIISFEFMKVNYNYFYVNASKLGRFIHNTYRAMHRNISVYIFAEIWKFGLNKVYSKSVQLLYKRLVEKGTSVKTQN